MPQILVNRATLLRAIVPTITAIVFAIAIVITIDQQRIVNEASKHHTQTLQEIQQAVAQLKSSNATDHEQTVKYINCVLVGITSVAPSSSSQSQVLGVYQECLANAGIDTTK